MTKRGRPRKERYARLMGGFWRNEKVRRLSLEARGLLATAWSYAADQATDGRIPVELLRAWAGSKHARLMKELAGFLEVPSGAIDAHAHDWLAVNISAEDYERQLELERSRKRKPDEYPAGKSPGKVPDIPPGNPANIRVSALDEDEDEDDDLQVNLPEASEPGTRAPASEPPAADAAPFGPSESERIEVLEKRYPPALVAEARQGCALSRRSGRMADSVWLTTLERLDKLPAPAVVAALRVYVERHADGDKGEAYLVGIARREAKGGGRHASAPIGRLSPVEVDAESARESQRRARELFGGGPLGEVANG